MNNFFKKIIIVLGTIFSLYASAHGAVITIVAPEKALANRQLVTVQVFLDGEGDVMSGISGNFSYDAELFNVQNISTESSVVSLWIKQPTVSNEIYLDGRTHVTFEGIFPGGYMGVRSPYYEGMRPGKVFTITLIPKNKGVGNFVVDDIVLNTYNSEATPLKTESVIRSIAVPHLIEGSPTLQSNPVEVKNGTLLTFVTRDPLVNNNAWYLIVNEEQKKSAVDTIYVAETDDWNAHLVDESMWKKSSSQHILLYQKRTKYIHVKVAYSDATYTLTTLSPVENSTSIPIASRILLSVALALLALYLYGKYFFTPPSQ